MARGLLRRRAPAGGGRRPASFELWFLSRRASFGADVVLSTPVAAEIQFGLERLVRGSRKRRLLEADEGPVRPSRRTGKIEWSPPWPRKRAPSKWRRIGHRSFARPS